MIDVAPGAAATAVDGLEAVVRRVSDNCRVVAVPVIRARAVEPVIGKPGVDTGSGEAVDLGRSRGDERNVDAPSDRMLVVGLRYREVPPDREARGGGGLLDPKLIERCREGRGGGG